MERVINNAGPSSEIEWTFHCQAAAVKNMCVDHGSFDIFMAEKLLDRSYIIAIFEEMSGKTMAEGVRGDGFNHGGEPDGALEIGLIEVVTLFDACDRIDREVGRRKNILPGKFAVGVRIFLFQSIGQIRRAITRSKVKIVLRFHLFEV